MKIRVVSALMLISMSMQANNVTRSFFSVRPFYEDVMVQDGTLHSEHTMGGHVDRKKSVQFTAFMSESTEKDELGKYFFQGLGELRVRDERANDEHPEEILQQFASWDLNVKSEDSIYDAMLKISPRQRVYGGTVSFNGFFGKDKQYNMSVEVPVVHVKNELRLKETLANSVTVDTDTRLDELPYLDNMTDAFKQKNMKYGKIDDSETKKTGFGDIVVKVGFEPECCQSDDRYMNLYAGAVLPTSNKPKAEYMFEAILGNNQHFGLMMGVQGHALVKTWKNRRIWVRWNSEGQYLFENKQKRSFDLLVNGVWSRYLSVYTSLQAVDDEIPTFGINAFTLDSKVTPGYKSLMNMSVVLAGDKWHGSVGMSTHVRQGEKIKLDQALLSNELYIAAYALGYTNRYRQTGKEYDGLEVVDADEFVAIKSTDLDLESAAHPANITHRFYASVGGYRECERPVKYELGGSYEYSQFNTGMNRWGACATLQISF